MEYKLLKTIERPMCTLMPNETLPRLSPYPAFDFVNPGLGQISRLYSFYVPLHTRKNLHSIEKKIENVNTDTANLDSLEGGGIVEDINDTETKQLNEDPLTFNEKRKKRLGSPVHESFLHPKFVKTNHIYLPNSTTSKTKKRSEIDTKSGSGSKIIKHKFQFL
jgi:hypothetical protein